MAVQVPVNEDSETLLRENPALRLVEFFRAGVARAQREFQVEADVDAGAGADSDASTCSGLYDSEPPGIVRMSCSKLESVSGALRAALEMNEGNVKRWVARWRESGFI